MHMPFQTCVGTPLAVQQSCISPVPQRRWCLVAVPVSGCCHTHAVLTGRFPTQNISGVPKLEEGLNPATWMLQISTPGMEANLNTDFNEQYRNSRLYQCTSLSDLLPDLSAGCCGRTSVMCVCMCIVVCT